MKKLIQKIKDGTAKQILQELRWISAYGRKYLWVILWNIFLGILGTALGLAASVLSKDIIDIVTGHQTGYIVWVAVTFVVMQLVKILLSAATGRISAKVQLRVSQELRRDIFGKILDAQWEPLSRYHSGDLISRSGKDVDTVAAGVMGWVPSLIVNSLQLVGTFFVLFWFDKVLAILALASAPVTILVSGFLAKRIRKHSKQMRQIGSDLTAFHAETFQGISFIKAFHATDYYCRQLEQHQARQKDATLDYNRFSILTSSMMSLLGMVVGGVCFFWSVYRLWGGHITFGEMTLFLQLSGGLSGAFGALVSLVPAAISAATAAGRIMEVTQLPVEDSRIPPELDAIRASGAVHIEAKNLSFSYERGQEILQNSTFQVAAGETVALVGPSGSGKTTLLRLLLGMIQPKDGSITLGSPDATVTVCPATRELFAYVPQDNTMFSGTIRENLRITREDATDEALWEVLQIACAADFVRELPDGLETRLGERGGGLSQGQLQRLNVARALLSGKPVLLLDEATSALDAETEAKLLHNLMLCRQNRTCIITTHRPSVLKLCHRAYRVEKGTVSPVEPTQ